MIYSRRFDDASMALQLIAKARFPTRYGLFEVVGFRNGDDAPAAGRGLGGGSPRPAREHVAVVRGDVDGADRVPVRVHSQCLTGDVLGSLRCDCRDQLEQSLAFLATQERGVLVYLAQEGRGIGLANKIAAYALQDAGMDTMEANQHLGFAADLRDYGDAAEMLQLLGIASVDLITNNPAKVEGLEQHGVKVVARTPLAVDTIPENERYIETKAAKAGHLIDDEARAATKLMLRR